MDVDLKVLKGDLVEPEQHMVYGEVYAPNRPDSDGEFMNAETIRKMAHDFARQLRFKQVDVQHNNQTVDGVQVVESFIARKGDPDFLPDAWVVGIHIPDAGLWDQVLKGEINGLSIEAMVGRSEREVEIEIPPVIRGVTSKTENHTHEFYVSYDENGIFRGGVTSMAEGHLHVIKAGTVTEATQDHTHRFSSVDHVLIS